MFVGNMIDYSTFWRIEKEMDELVVGGRKCISLL